MERNMDPIVEDVRKRGRALTERNGNNVEKIMKLMKKVSAEYKSRIVSQIRVV